LADQRLKRGTASRLESVAGPEAHPLPNSAGVAGAPEPPRAVFISHKHEDQEAVMHLVSFLEQRGIRCWVSYRDIPYGGHFPQQITAALHRAPAVLVYVSQAMLAESRHIERELTIADNCHIPIVPIFVQDFQSLGGLEFFLSVPQRFYLDQQGDAALERLAAYLLGAPLRGGAARPLPAAPAAKRWRLPAAIAAAALLAALAGWYALHHRALGEGTHSAPPAEPPRLAAAPVAAPAAAARPVPTTQQVSDAMAAQDYAKAKEMLLEMSIAGNTDAMAEIGLLYYLGRGVAEDEKEAEKWFAKSAAGGSALGKRNLEALHEQWEKSQKEFQTTLEAAAGGNADAQYQLAELYVSGGKVPKDLDKALTWLKRAAEGGHLEALNELGLCYFNGVGMNSDTAKARECFTKAAAGGLEIAQHNLEVMDRKTGKVTTAPVKSK